jgi:hypothetical protein
MNCFNHTKRTAVATCVACNKGLCKQCGKLYTPPLCSECILKQCNNEINNFNSEIILTVVFFLIGTCLGIVIGFSLQTIFFYGYTFAGIYWGWKICSFFQAYNFFYILVKCIIALSISLFALPIGIILLIQKYRKEIQKKNVILQNISNV